MAWNGLAQAYQFDTQQWTTCCRCGVEFASPVISERRADGNFFYCPNGHSQHFTETEATTLRKQLERTQRDLEWARSQRETTEKRLSAQRGLTTKAKNKLARVHAGVCPECNRSFSQLAEHMKQKHPQAKESQ